MDKVFYKIESKFSRSNDWVSAWSTEFEQKEEAIEVLFEYLANRISGEDNCHYRIIEVTVKSIMNTENAIKKKLKELF